MEKKMPPLTAWNPCTNTTAHATGLYLAKGKKPFSTLDESKNSERVGLNESKSQAVLYSVSSKSAVKIAYTN